MQIFHIKKQQEKLFSPFYKQINMSMSVSAIFSVPQQH